MNLLPTRDLADAERTVIEALARWHGPVTVVAGQSLEGVDFVLALPGGNDGLTERARRAGVRVVEVVGGGGRIQDDHGRGER